LSFSVNHFKFQQSANEKKRFLKPQQGGFRGRCSVWEDMAIMGIIAPPPNTTWLPSWEETRRCSTEPELVGAFIEGQKVLVKPNTMM
jgi:hypothetical protein